MTPNLANRISPDVTIRMVNGKQLILHQLFDEIQDGLFFVGAVYGHNIYVTKAGVKGGGGHRPFTHMAFPTPISPATDTVLVALGLEAILRAIAPKQQPAAPLTQPQDAEQRDYEGGPNVRWQPSDEIYADYEVQTDQSYNDTRHRRKPDGPWYQGYPPAQKG